LELRRSDRSLGDGFGSVQSRNLIAHRNSPLTASSQRSTAEDTSAVLSTQAEGRETRLFSKQVARPCRVRESEDLQQFVAKMCGCVDWRARKSELEPTFVRIRGEAGDWPS